MKYRAIFFDRDGTLTRNSPDWEELRRDCLSRWSGRPFQDSEEFFMRNFRRVLNGGFPFAPYHNVDEELQFFRQWYLFAFEELGITENIEERADFLTEHLWYLKKEPYSETEEVLRYFQKKGFRIGVISDCPPSLELSLRNCGLHDYFTSFTASSLVGAGKPSPIIFQAALTAQDVSASEVFLSMTHARKPMAPVNRALQPSGWTGPVKTSVNLLLKICWSLFLLSKRKAKISIHRRNYHCCSQPEQDKL